jgi:mRNA interferase MazF
MSVGEYWPEAGDLVWTDFDPTIGREQAGRRPALIVSPAAFTRNTGFAFVCPITTRIRPFPTSVVLPDGLPIAGEILISHLRSIDALARRLRSIGAAVPPQTAAEVRAKLEALIAI